MDRMRFPSPDRLAPHRSAAILGVLLLALSATAGPVQAEQMVVVSITSGSLQTICDTDCTTCTVGSGECVEATDGDLLLCDPISTGVSGEIDGCEWKLLFDGDDPSVDDDLELNQQLRAAEIAPNGSIVFVVSTTDTIPGLTLKNNDIVVFQPADVSKPYVGGGPYTTSDGTFKVYLDGELTQQDAAAKPWDALEIIPDGSCEDLITTSVVDDPTCDALGSLTGGSGSGNFGGIEFANEDLIRCIPTGFGNGAVQACDYAVMLDSSAINGGGGAGITSDIEAIEFLSLDESTLDGQMVFLKKSGNPTGFPPHEAGRDLLVYDGSFGSGLCSTSSTNCAGDSDCPLGETCDTGSCVIGGAPCGTKQDCSGAGNDCAHTRPYSATISLYFDGSAVGLSGSGQRLEGFSLVPDADGDLIPDGPDNCPDVANPPSLCSDGSTPCPSGMSSECPMGEVCEQVDSDGDGVGDVCDECVGRDDGTCFCGDFILDSPSEQCDLGDPLAGGENGEPGSPCTGDCMILGVCTGTSAAICDSAGDCPPGEGCCGNAIPEGPEACDDGNSIEDDLCDSSCNVVPGGVAIDGCEDSAGQPLTGPNLVPAGIKLVKFRNTAKIPDFDRWKVRGDFNFEPSIALDPENQEVKIVFSNSLSGVLLEHTLPAGEFELKTNTPTRKKWLFKDKEADVPGAGSWRKGKFLLKGNEVKYTLDGRATVENGLGALFTLADLDSPPVVRQTIRIGDLCVTTLLSPPACEIKGTGKTVKCKP